MNVEDEHRLSQPGSKSFTASCSSSSSFSVFSNFCLAEGVELQALDHLPVALAVAVHG